MLPLRAKDHGIIIVKIETICTGVNESSSLLLFDVFVVVLTLTFMSSYVFFYPFFCVSKVTHHCLVMLSFLYKVFRVVHVRVSTIYLSNLHVAVTVDLYIQLFSLPQFQGYS